MRCSRYTTVGSAGSANSSMVNGLIGCACAALPNGSTWSVRFGRAARSASRRSWARMTASPPTCTRSTLSLSTTSQAGAGLVEDGLALDPQRYLPVEVLAAAGVRRARSTARA